ncbi:hypothetical protein OMP40_35465 [Cohnella rhizosphaerae]|uniref:Uncharacterized protein n=1 Tax=Cohnella rhizosphaerae TaxID=1457232 RepID=A0A9X4KZY9_9BACL|nr:hypothetical protein [Cohnella rhizosphaerae]MDG0813995.1 hypothetical protein [Cohnella rhizosphaerae]
MNRKRIVLPGAIARRFMRGAVRSAAAGGRFIRGWRLGIALAAVAWIAVAAFASAAQADEQTKLTAVAVQMTASDKGVVYQSYANRYVVGPNGWLEWKITVKEKLAGFTEGALYVFDKDSALNWWERSRAVIKRQEGDHTLVFRFEPGLSDPSGPLTLDRKLALDGQYGSIKYYALNPDNGQTVLKSTTVIDLSGISGMAAAQFKREYPTLTITPNPADLQRGGQPPSGLSVDRIIVDVKDAVLDPQDFEFKYRLSAGMYSKSVDWTTMAERNYIPVPPEARGKAADLDIEVRDSGGNWRPYTLFYPGPGGFVESRVTMNPFYIIGGGSGDAGGRYLQMLADGGVDPAMRADVLRTAVADFKFLRQTYEMPKNAYTWLAAFVYSTGQKSVNGYKGYADVDLTASGYLWSTSSKLPVDNLPVKPFSDTYQAVETNPLNGRQYEGYWAVLPNGDTSALGEGAHYLYVKTVDAVTGGFMWQQVYYDADRFLTDKNATNPVPVKLIKDTTPLTIDFADQPLARGDYVVEAHVADNTGLGAVQYMVSEFDFCARSPGACESMGAKWTDVPLAAGGRTAQVGIDTTPYFTDRSALRLYVYVRGVEQRHKQPPYDKDPFAAGNKANIVAASSSYYVLRGSDALELKATYVDRVDAQGRLASAPEHKVRLYTHAAGLLAAEGDVRYRIEKAGGDVVQDWKNVPSGQEIVLAGADGEYLLRAQPLDAEGKAAGEPYAQSFVIGPAVSATAVSASFSTTEMTNQDVVLTLTTGVPVKVLNADGVDPAVADTSHTLTIKNATPFGSPLSIQIQPDGGETETIRVSVGQIDKTGFGPLAGGGAAIYTNSQPTAGEVTAYLYVGKRVKPGVGDGIAYRNGWLSYTFAANGEHVFEVEDLAGSALRGYVSENNRKAVVTWIDSTAPAVSVSYSTTALTNKPVTASVQLPDGFAVINNGGERVLHVCGQRRIRLSRQRRQRRRSRVQSRRRQYRQGTAGADARRTAHLSGLSGAAVHVRRARLYGRRQPGRRLDREGRRVQSGRRVQRRLLRDRLYGRRQRRQRRARHSERVGYGNERDQLVRQPDSAARRHRDIAGNAALRHCRAGERRPGLQVSARQARCGRLQERRYADRGPDAYA